MTTSTSTLAARHGRTTARRPIIVIDALHRPDGITCGHCRRARSVAEKDCVYCDALMRSRG